MPREATENISLAAEAYGIVRDRILRGELSIGAVVSRRTLASELGMSFLPVSEALMRLEFEVELIAKLRSLRYYGGLPLDARTVTDEIIRQEGK